MQNSELLIVTEVGRPEYSYRWDLKDNKNNFIYMPTDLQYLYVGS